MRNIGDHIAFLHAYEDLSQSQMLQDERKLAIYVDSFGFERLLDMTKF